VPPAAFALFGILKKALPAGIGAVAAPRWARDFRRRRTLAMPGASA
jgi:hypothetical protein